MFCPWSRNVPILLFDTRKKKIKEETLTKKNEHMLPNISTAYLNLKNI